ncbi:MAG: DUF503 domain-containing protein [Phycisphaerales bacterium]|nr:DUF503 domain-containing protein [Phycisphaerales bacterium]
MYIALLQFEIEVPGAESLKDKRRVVSSVKDKLHREHQCSVAEVGNQENASLAVMALAIVGSDRKHLRSVIDSIEHKLRSLPEGRLGAMEHQMLSAQEIAEQAGAGGDLESGPVWSDSELDAIDTGDSPPVPPITGSSGDRCSGRTDGLTNSQEHAA